MISDALRIIATAAVITLCALWPFFPGPYDVLAVPVSTMAQVFGYVGLLLVPVGAIWLTTNASARSPAVQRTFTIITLVAGGLVWAFVSLGGLVSGSVLLTVVSLVAGIWIFWELARRESGIGRALPVYLITVPTAAFLLQYALVGRAIEFSRDRAIRNSGPLIAEIERHYSAFGRYPESLLAEWNDIWPSVIGIKEYRYEPSGDSYNVVFEQPSNIFGTREFVVYNPRDQQIVFGHAIDRLQFTGPALQRRAGFYAVLDAGHPHWKLFRFD